MTGSDNVCYVKVNKGVSGFDSVANITESQAARAGESAQVGVPAHRSESPEVAS